MSGPVFVAKRLFFRRHRESRGGHPLIGTSVGIALSLVPLITVDHVVDAMIESIVARYRETSTFHFQIHHWGETERDEWEKFAEETRTFDSVSDAWVERQGFGLARAAGSREGLTLRSLPSNLPERDSAFASFIEFDSGRWDLSTSNSILLGRESSRKLGAAVNDEIRILTVRRLFGERYVPRVSRFIVRGVFSSGYQDLDRTWAFIPLETGWSILSSESSLTFIGGKFRSPNGDLNKLSMPLATSLSGRWSLYNWRELNDYLLSNLETTRRILLLIMALIILVAVFNVTSSLMMLVLERQREIGILKCAGCSPSKITGTFVLAGAMASALGILAGIGCGLLVARFINEIIIGIEAFLGLFTMGNKGPKLLIEGYYLQHIPIQIRWKSTILIGLATFLLSLVASAMPSSRAAGLKPLDVLRKH